MVRVLAILFSNLPNLKPPCAARVGSRRGESRLHIPDGHAVSAAGSVVWRKDGGPFVVGKGQEWGRGVFSITPHLTCFYFLENP